MNDTIHSVVDDSDWNKVLVPKAAALQNEKQNKKFVKKLVAVAISNILYLRADLPDDSFKENTLGTLQLRTLQKTKGNPESTTNQLIEIIKNGMAALDKGYLRKLSLVFFDTEAENADDFNNAYETYSFYFGKQDKDFSLSLSPKNQGDVQLIGQPSILTEQKVMKMVKGFMKRLVGGTQELDVLPEVASLKVCAEYYDDLTPEDYEPKGFVHSDTRPQVVNPDTEPDPFFLGVGQIDMMHQKMALRVKSKAKALTTEDELHPQSLERNSQQNDVLQNIQNLSVCDAEMSDQSNLQLSARQKKQLKMGIRRKRVEGELQESDNEDNRRHKKYGKCESDAELSMGKKQY